jgi:hypothetical protein
LQRETISSSAGTDINKSGGRQSAVVLSNAGATANVFHGRLTPAAPGARRRFAEKITTFAVHKRIFARAAGVSPPWAANRISNSNAMNFRVSSSHAEGIPRGAYAPQLLVLLQRPFAGKNGDFCGAQTHIPRSVARQPAVGLLARS